MRVIHLFEKMQLPRMNKERFFQECIAEITKIMFKVTKNGRATILQMEQTQKLGEMESACPLLVKT